MPTTYTADQATKAAKDFVYATIGLGVLAVQKLQVGRNELAKWLDGQIGDAKGSLGTVQVKVEDGLKTIEERLTALEGQAEDVLEELQGRLPESVQDLATQAIDFATKARTELIDRFGYAPSNATKSKTTKAA